MLPPVPVCGRRMLVTTTVPDGAPRPRSGPERWHTVRWYVMAGRSLPVVKAIAVVSSGGLCECGLCRGSNEGSSVAAGWSSALQSLVSTSCPLELPRLPGLCASRFVRGRYNALRMVSMRPRVGDSMDFPLSKGRCLLNSRRRLSASSSVESSPSLIVGLVAAGSFPFREVDTLSWARFGVKGDKRCNFL